MFAKLPHLAFIGLPHNRHRIRKCPSRPNDGTIRLIPMTAIVCSICRNRPRGVSKADETWDVWEPHLGPSKELHAAVYRTTSSPLEWPEYRQRYLAEMRDQKPLIDALAARVKQGETITPLFAPPPARGNPAVTVASG